MLESAASCPPRPKRASLADVVYEILLGHLIDGTVAAGSSLNIDALAREMNVSQTPIREALARLESTGLVTRAVLKGYRVAPLFTEKELADLMDARAVIEPTNAFLACSRSRPTLLAELEESIAELESVAKTGPDAEFLLYWEADQRFHTLIAAACDNAFLRAAYDSFGGHVQRFRLFGVLGITDAEYAIAEHRQILHAFERGDAARARSCMAEHVHNVKIRALSDREALPEV